MIMTALGGAVMGLAGGFWKVLLWFRESEDKRIKEAVEMAKLLGGLDNESQD
jgi:hypothetical protein